MERIGERLIWYYAPFTYMEIPGPGINTLTVLNTVFVMGILWKRAMTRGLCSIWMRICWRRA